MTRIANIILFGALLISISCEEKPRLPALRKSFSSSQISDFKTITKFFSEQICQNNKRIEFKDCFEEILPTLVEHGMEPIFKYVDFEKQKEMYKSISKSTFNQIWGYEKIYGASNRKSSYRSIKIASEGKYVKYLKKVGLKNKFLSEYVQGIWKLGRIESFGHLEACIYNNPQDFDLEEPTIQLLISIHYLTLNDRYTREEVWKEE